MCECSLLHHFQIILFPSQFTFKIVIRELEQILQTRRVLVSLIQTLKFLNVCLPAPDKATTSTTLVAMLS